MFNSISDYKDSKDLAAKCIELRENLKNIEQKIQKFTTSLKKNQKLAKEKEKQLLELSKEISKLNDNKEALTQLSLSLGNTLDEIAQINSIVKKNSERITKLKNTRTSLGLFAIKKKKEIDLEIVSLDSESQTLKESLPVLQKKTQGYSLVEDLTSDLASVNQQLNTLNKQKAKIEAKTIKTEDEMISEMVQTEEGKLVIAHYQKILEYKKKYQTGNVVSFGSYQGNPIKWKVLSMSEDKALLVTQEAIDCKKYNEKYKDVTWKTCTLR